MSRAFPYRRPPLDVIAARPWLQVGPSGVHELAAELPTWDYSSVLHLRRAMRIDGLRARRTCGLAPDSELTLSVVWAANGSSLRGCLWQQPVSPDDGIEMVVDIEVAGGELGGRLDLETVLTLRERGSDTGSRIAPSRSGAVLWHDVGSTMLQGDSALFPLAVVDFKDVLYPTEAAWHLELGHNLEAQALGSILLLANSRKPAVTRALESAAQPSEADLRVLSVIKTDVVRSLVERAVTDEEFDLDESFPTGTIGALLVSVVRSAFPGYSLDALRRERMHEPILFTSRLQNATELLAGP